MKRKIVGWILIVLIHTLAAIGVWRVKKWSDKED